MLTDILQALFNATVINDEEAMEQQYIALEYYGMSRETADEVIVAGRQYFAQHLDWGIEAEESS